MRTRIHRHRRRGAILALFALGLVVVMLGMAALILDIGLVNLTQTQMQDATDAIALDALRKGPEGLGQVDDLAEQTWEQGFGPVLDLQDTLTLGDKQVGGVLANVTPWRPESLKHDDLEDAEDADIRFGNYFPQKDHTEGNVGSPPYYRDDFSAATEEQDAVLVRLRRSRETPDTLSEFATIGPPVPLLFARGKATLFANQAMQEGLAVRATSIAQWKVAVSVHRVGLQVKSGTGSSLSITEGLVVAWPEAASEPSGKVVSPGADSFVGMSLTTEAFAAPDDLASCLVVFYRDFNGSLAVTGFGVTTSNSTLTPMNIVRTTHPRAIRNAAANFAHRPAGSVGELTAVQACRELAGSGALSPYLLRASALVRSLP